MPYKLDENGKIESKDGKPVYVNDDGVESLVDFDSLRTEINSTRSEAKHKKEKMRELQDRLKNFEGLDAEQARRALELMSNLDNKKLIEAGQMDAAIKQAVENTASKFQPQIKTFEEKLKAQDSMISQKDRIIRNQFIDKELASSQYLNKNTNTTPDFRSAILGKNLKVVETETGDLKAVAFDDQGNEIFSPNNPAQHASLDEAVQILWNRYPYKDTYSKAGLSGTGSTGNPGGQGKSVYTQSEWLSIMSKADRTERAALTKKFMANEITVKKTG